MRGAVVWLTGLSGAGKSTLAEAVAAQIARTHPARPVQILDGDEIRRVLSPALGFSRNERAEHVLRLGYVARLLAQHGVLVLVAAIAPYADVRAALRAASHGTDHDFLEIYVHAPLATVLARDVKGLYERACTGEIPHFTGISDPYEPPTQPEIELRTDLESVTECEWRIVELLTTCGLVIGSRL